MARDDTRLHRLEAMVAGLLAWQHDAEARVAALEQHDHRIREDDPWTGPPNLPEGAGGPEPADSAGKSPGGPLGSQEPEHREHQQRDSRPAPAHPHDCIHTEVCHPYAERGVEACPCKHYDASPAPAQAAQPAPEPLKGPCPWCHRKSWSWTGNFWMCGICGGVLKPPAKAQPAPHPLEADLDSPDFDKFCAEVRGKPAPQQPLGPGLAELGACKHVWQHEAMAVDGDYYRCPLCNAHKMERRQPRSGGG